MVYRTEPCLPLEMCLNWGYKPSRIHHIESTLHHVIFKDVFREYSILLGACDSLFTASFLCFSGGVREELFTKAGMISEIIDKCPHPVRVFQPFDVGSACGHGGGKSSRLLCWPLLMFGLVHVWLHNTKGSHWRILCPQHPLACTNSHCHGLSIYQEIDYYVSALCRGLASPSELCGSCTSQFYRDWSTP